MKKSPVLLVILDGFGLNPNRLYNGIESGELASHPAWQALLTRTKGTLSV